MDRLIDAGENFGLKGEDLAAFFSKQKAIEREEMPTRTRGAPASTRSTKSQRGRR